MQTSLVVPKVNSPPERAGNTTSTSPEATECNPQLRQLLVSSQGELSKLQSADSGIDTHSNASDTPISVPSTLPHLQSSVDNSWSIPTKPTPTTYTSFPVPLRSPTLDASAPPPVPCSFTAAQPSQPVPTYVMNDQQIGLMCPTEQPSVFLTPQNEMGEFYNGYRTPLPTAQIYSQDTSYLHNVSFHPYDPSLAPASQQSAYLPSPPLPHVSCELPPNYPAHLPPAPMPVYADVRPQEFVAADERLTQLPSMSAVSQADEYQPNGQPMMQEESWGQMRAAIVPPPRVPSLSGNPNGQIQLWSFILDELENQESQDMLCWTGDGWEFRFKDPEKVAKKWGEQKNKPSMNYEKMSRGLRYYYDKDIIRKSSSGGRYHYRFTDKKMAERTPYPAPEYFRSLGITPQKEESGK